MHGLEPRSYRTGQGHGETIKLGTRGGGDGWVFGFQF